MVILMSQHHISQYGKHYTPLISSYSSVYSCKKITLNEMWRTT